MRSKSKMTREEAIRWLESVGDADLPSVLATEVPSGEAYGRATTQVVRARRTGDPETPIVELVEAWMGNVKAASFLCIVLIGALDLSDIIYRVRMFKQCLHLPC
jgi:hypothetical protein